MSTSGVPLIKERRPKRPRRCLNCGKWVRTTISARLCPTCTIRAQQLRGGVDESVVSLKERGWRRVLPAP